MTEDRVQRLAEAVERLTQPHRTQVRQTLPSGDEHVATVAHAPLLKTLKDAIGGEVGRHATGKQAFEKTPINVAALELFDTIAGEVVAALKVWAPASPGWEEIWQAVSRLWLAFENRRRAGKVGRVTFREFEQLVFSWVRRIDNMFDPPDVFEITRKVSRGGVERDVPEACPECGEMFAIDPTSGNRVFALRVEYRRNLGADMLRYANALCRFCGTVWAGGSGVRALRWRLDQREAVGA